MFMTVVNSVWPPGAITRPVRSSAAVHPQLVIERTIRRGLAPTFQSRVVPCTAEPGGRIPKAISAGSNSTAGGAPAGWLWYGAPRAGSRPLPMSVAAG